MGYGRATAWRRIGSCATRRPRAPALRQPASRRVKRASFGRASLERASLGRASEVALQGRRDVPDDLEVDHSKITATFVRTPGLGDVPYPVMMEPNLVVEYYAKN